MRTRPDVTRLLALALLPVAVACGGEHADTRDAESELAADASTPGMDAAIGPDAALDAATPPAVPPDAALDAGTPPATDAETDAGSPTDAAVDMADATIDASEPADAGDAGAVDPAQPLLVDECQVGSLSAGQIQALKAGGAVAGARLLYPYDGTVFPQGIQGPLLMWESAAASEAVLVHIASPALEYTGCFVPTGENRLQLPDEIWTLAGQNSQGKAAPYRVELTVLGGGKAQGPISQQWILAQGTLKGSLYYTNYNASAGSQSGQLFRIPQGGAFEPLLGATECVSCHSVSANGSRMAAQTLGTGGRTYALSTGSPQALANPSASAYVAMYPDGSRYVRPSLEVEVARSVLTSPSLAGAEAGLFETDTGAALASTGLPPGALMPSFSPDGTLLVFNDADSSAAHDLASVRFDALTNSASDYQVIFSDDTYRPGWPHALPDNAGVVFVRTDGSEFSANGAGALGIGEDLAPYSELFLVDLTSGTSSIMANAMGYRDAEAAAEGESYLPYGEEDLSKSYFPTVSPVAAGGYFWVFFDSIRHYGNLGLQRQIWATAVEISADGDYTADRSSPAFYLPGQELGAGNRHAQSALDACKVDGSSCSSGTDCCGGYCAKPSGAAVEAQGTCASDLDVCAKDDERCASDADCCEGAAGDATHRCIAGFCALVNVP